IDMMSRGEPNRKMSPVPTRSWIALNDCGVRELGKTDGFDTNKAPVTTNAITISNKIVRSLSVNHIHKRSRPSVFSLHEYGHPGYTRKKIKKNKKQKKTRRKKKCRICRLKHYVRFVWNRLLQAKLL